LVKWLTCPLLSCQPLNGSPLAVAGVVQYAELWAQYGVRLPGDTHAEAQDRYAAGHVR
jgi:hypothetical protein